MQFSLRNNTDSFWKAADRYSKNFHSAMRCKDQQYLQQRLQGLLQRFCFSIESIKKKITYKLLSNIVSCWNSYFNVQLL